MGDIGEKVIPVKVAVRSRPLLQWELESGSKDCVNFISEAQQVKLCTIMLCMYNRLCFVKLQVTTIYM